MGKSTRPQGGARAGRDKLEALRKEQQAKERRTRLALITSVLTVIVLIGGIVAFTIYRDVSGRPTLDAVKTYTVTRDHTTDPVTYAQSPPVGGNHNPTWLNCGVYTAPVKNENAVHSLEHGAVWVTYRPDLPAADVAKLVASVPDTYMVVSPYEGLDAPVVASAWGVQLKLTGVGDQRLAEFIKQYRNGPQTPEPGASCTGGTDGTSTGGATDAPPPSMSPSPSPTASQ
ncbi:DUF3105 domain-containing protein [Oryzobacter telluris]|uniref:DUF3105 domain-containing protein n=1 Tax=Oryzobacter telluris TaxID=3149179 RepID=UPI00370D275A